MFNISPIAWNFFLLALNLFTIIVAYRGWYNANLLKDLINHSPTVCISCGAEEFGHETLVELGMRKYIEAHEFIPVQAVYLPDDDLRYRR